MNNKSFTQIPLWIFVVLIFITPSFALEEKGEVPIQNTAAIWNNTPHEEKIKVIAAVIEMYKKQGIAIKKDPEFYVQEIELNRFENIDMFATPVGVQLRVTVMMYRDFDNGEDPDELIKKEFGEDFYLQYKEMNMAENLEKNYQTWLQSKK